VIFQEFLTSEVRAGWDGMGPLEISLTMLSDN
jgi:hypothetical protein